MRSAAIGRLIATVVTAAIVLGAMAAPAAARLVFVGPARPLKLPSLAAALVQPGDIVRIDAGTYIDCAVWRTPGITIQGTGREVVLTGRVCLGQAIFLIEANDVTIQGLTFRDATSDGHNAAGIKMVGNNLTVRNSRFEHNENGILAGGSSASKVRISDSVFIGNGACINACAHGVYAGEAIGLLEIERCVFLDTRTAHHIKSRALQTVVRDSRIEDGESGTSSYLIETPQGGDLLVQNNSMQKGPNSSNPVAAIAIAAGGARNPTAKLVIRDNRFRNDAAAQTIFVRNETQTPAELIDNQVDGPVRMLEGPGSITP